MTAFVLGMLLGAAFATLGSLLAHRKTAKMIDRLITSNLRARSEARQYKGAARFWHDVATAGDAEPPKPQRVVDFEEL